ncbi:hypothetical protein OY671_009458, partial [Metschnikowia pulcherrima]
GKIFGTIDTREKFVDKRSESARHEWARFKANDSSECRNCHNYDYMDFTRQSVRAQNMHSTYSADKSKTCIDCHKGIAHHSPEVKSQGNPASAALTSEARGAAIETGKRYYSVMPQPLYADPESTREIGASEIATDAKVSQKKNDAVQVESQLWRKNKGYARVLYGRFGSNITSAVSAKEVSRDDDSIHVLETQVDKVTGSEWQKISAT